MGKLLKFGLIGLGAALLLFVVAMVAGYYWLLGYLKSEGFRDMVKHETGKSFQMEIDLMPLNWSGTSIYTDGLQGKALDDNPVQSLRAEQLRANLNLYGVLDGVWDVPSIELQQLRLKLESPHQKGSHSVTSPHKKKAHADKPKQKPAEEGETVAAPDQAAHQEGLASYLPSEVKIGQVSIQEVDVEWVPEGSPPIKLKEMKVLAEPRGNAWDVFGQKGVLTIPEWPKMQIPEIKLRATETAIFVTEAKLRVKRQGNIELSGEVETTEDQQLNLAAKVQRLPLSTLLEGDWRMRILGNIFGKAKAEGSLRAPEGLTVSGNVRLQDGRLEALPVLNEIAAVTKYDEFRSVPLQQARAKFKWTPQKLEVRNLMLKSEGLLVVKGNFTQKGILLSGKLEVGTTPRALRFLPGAEKYVFTKKHDGYVWTEMNLSGTTLKPEEDLSQRLKDAAILGIGEGAAETVIDVMDKAQEYIPNIFGN